ncbi:MAG: hypothetical protein HFF17_07025 [Oscillospiraceae bacterium]|nr:hypothetical protein [Oscillospiraceae bacterium]
MVYETICEMLSQCLSCDEARIRKGTVILQDLECGPADLAEVLMGIEEELGVSVPEDFVTGSTTVAELARFVEDQL